MSLSRLSAKLLFGGLVAVILAGCTSQPGTTTAAIPSDVPAECATTNLVTVKSAKAGTVNPEVANSYFKNWRKDVVQLIFANYAVDPQDIYSNITAGRVLTVVKLAHVDGTQLTKGVFYKADTVDGQAVNKTVDEFNISTVDLAGGVFDNNGKVDVKVLTDKYACGEISADDGSSSIKGNFIAKFLTE